MTLTVRLGDALESALERHCAERGVTRSAVVQESLSAYLMGQARSRQPGARARSASPAFDAFRRAGLVGAGELAGVSADKAAVRAAVRTRVAQRTKRRTESR